MVSASPSPTDFLVMELFSKHYGDFRSIRWQLNLSSNFSFYLFLFGLKIGLAER